MMDPLLSLAFSMHSNKGVYASLLGSGISRAAEIPTGWEIVLDLISKLAVLEGEDCQPDLETWYRDKYGEDPDYALLLEKIAHASSERSQLLKGYFEPSEDERERGVKTPTEAHHAIAQLVTKGYVKVILTTNFDRLMERALEAAGINPIVVSSTDALNGALPLVHSPCTVIKLHGDYLDCRIKNTPDELAEYEDAQNQLLDRIFDEFGLIICGWSGEWDTALKAAMERCPTRRFSTYWTHIRPPSEAAEALIAHRKAEKINIQGANQFFTALLDKVSSLEELERPHPLSAKLAIASVKRYLVDDKYRIRLADFVKDETEKVFRTLTGDSFGMTAYSIEEVFSRMQRFEAILEILLPIMITGAFWGRPEQAGIWLNAQQRILDSVLQGSGSTGILDASLYPALLLHYATGVSCLASNNYETWKQLLSSRRRGRGEDDFIFQIFPGSILRHDALNQLQGTNYHLPVNDRIHDILREPLRDVIPDDRTYSDTFDKFEYLRSLVEYDHELNNLEFTMAHPTIGRFGWRNKRTDEHISRIVQSEIDTQGTEWPLIKFGYFGGKMDRLNQVKESLDNAISRLHWH